MEYQYHIFSPYRVCPLGAHVDHQHGLVTGFAIDKGVDLWFNVQENGKVHLASRSFEGEVGFDVTAPSQVKEQRPSFTDRDGYKASSKSPRFMVYSISTTRDLWR